MELLVERVQLAEGARIFDVSELRSGEKERGGGIKERRYRKRKELISRTHEGANTRAHLRTIKSPGGHWKER